MELMMHPQTMYKLSMELIITKATTMPVFVLLERDLQKGTICDMFFQTLQTRQCHIPNSWLFWRRYNFVYFWRFMKFQQN